MASASDPDPSQELTEWVEAGPPRVLAPEPSMSKEDLQEFRKFQEWKRTEEKKGRLLAQKSTTTAPTPTRAPEAAPTRAPEAATRRPDSTGPVSDGGGPVSDGGGRATEAPTAYTSTEAGVPPPWIRTGVDLTPETVVVQWTGAPPDKNGIYPVRMCPAGHRWKEGHSNRITYIECNVCRQRKDYVSKTVPTCQHPRWTRGSNEHCAWALCRQCGVMAYYWPIHLGDEPTIWRSAVAALTER